MQEPDQHTMDPGQPVEQRRHLAWREDDRAPRGRLGADDAVEERQLDASTSRYRNRTALVAWFCVEAATSRSVARCVGKRTRSALSSSEGGGCGGSRCSVLIQTTYACISSGVAHAGIRPINERER